MSRTLTQITLTILLSFLLGACSKKSSGTKENYIVVFSKQARGQMATKSSVFAAMEETTERYKLDKPSKVFNHALQGGVIEMTEEEAAEMALEPGIAYVEKDQIISINATQDNATWGLDRIDQDSRPLDGSYSYPEGGAAVNAYVIDTGILTTHNEFQGRAASGADLVDNDDDATDCNGHGTHVAGTGTLGRPNTAWLRTPI